MPSGVYKHKKRTKKSIEKQKMTVNLKKWKETKGKEKIRKFKRTHKERPEIMKKREKKRLRTLKEYPEIMQEAGIKHRQTNKKYPEIERRRIEKHKQTNKEMPEILEQQGERLKQTYKKRPEIREQQKQSLMQTYKKYPEIKKQIGETSRRTYIKYPEKREQQSKIHIQLWQNPEYAKMMFLAQSRKPNKLEIFLDGFLQKEFPNCFKYVGDGKVWIGGKCPDFINFKNKQIIELFGSYWHKVDDAAIRTKHFIKYGYNCLVIWDYELKNLVLLKDKIIKFFNIKLQRKKEERKEVRNDN